MIRLISAFLLAPVGLALIFAPGILSELLGPSAVEGRVPKLGLLVSIREAYTQCPKALIRSELWNPARHVKRSELPSSGQILRSLHGEEFDAEGYDRERAARYARREGFY